MSKYVEEHLDTFFPGNKEHAMISRKTLKQLMMKSYKQGKKERHLSPPPKYTPDQLPENHKELKKRISTEMDKKFGVPQRLME